MSRSLYFLRRCTQHGLVAVTLVAVLANLTAGCTVTNTGNHPQAKGQQKGRPAATQADDAASKDHRAGKDQGAGDGQDAAKPAATGLPPVDKVLLRGDRVLFVGDEITQQMFYTRAVAAAMLALRPQRELRFFNGGRTGATASSTRQWVDELLDITRPTVVFICLGMNDAHGKALNSDDANGESPTGKASESKTNDAEGASLDDRIVAQYRKDLGSLIDRVRKHKGVRTVTVITSPAAQSEANDPPQGVGVNRTLHRLSNTAIEVARKRGAGYIDLFEHTHLVYATVARIGGKPLTFGGRHPTEEAHTIIASIVLYGIGVTGEQLDSIRWAPLTARKMARVRNALMLKSQPVGVEDANRCRAVYTAVLEHDDLFFRAWRIAKPKAAGEPGKRTGPSREEYLVKAKATWDRLSQFAAEQYAQRESKESVQPVGDRE